MIVDYDYERGVINKASRSRAAGCWIGRWDVFEKAIGADGQAKLSRMPLIEMWELKMGWMVRGEMASECELKAGGGVIRLEEGGGMGRIETAGLCIHLPRAIAASGIAWYEGCRAPKWAVDDCKM